MLSEISLEEHEMSKKNDFEKTQRMLKVKLSSL